MKFVISREALLQPLQLVSGVVEKRQTLPVLANVLLILEGQNLTLTGSDLEVEIIGKATLDNIGIDGEITLPARKLMDICKSLPEGANIEVSVDENKATLLSGRSKFTLATLAANEFPSINDINEKQSFSILQSNLKHLIESIGFAMAQQDVRYYLNGMLFEFSSQQIRAVATDGHRLATAMLEQSCCDETEQIIIPRKGVLELSKLMEADEKSATMMLSNNHIRVQTDEFIFTSKLIDGKFPDFSRVIPKNNTQILVANRQELKQVFQRASILSNEKYRGVRLFLKRDVLQVFANNPDQEQAEETLSVDYQGDEFEIGFNVSYLLEVINVIQDENIKLFLADSNSSALIEYPESNGCQYVVMPMRL